MKLSVLYSRASVGIKSPLVTVEVHLSRGIPGFHIVGLAETAVKESKDRVRSAILNSDFDFPLKKIIVNLAPADLPKEGCSYDLPIALGILSASGQLGDIDLDSYEFAGELALSGNLRPITGALPFALGTRAANRKLIIPQGNAQEASLPKDNQIYAADNLSQVFKHLKNIKKINKYIRQDNHELKNRLLSSSNNLDLSDVYGQTQAKRALEIAAAGGHSMLMSGPPGTGKTMLAMRLATILPDLTVDQALDVAAIYSIVSNNHPDYKWGARPFRSPHHTASAVAMVGGGSNPKPGEISLSHNGILFLDELPEFDRKVIEVLREPIESGKITISRAARQAEYPAKFQLIAAMNPCPCGYLGSKQKECNCTSLQIQRYRSKVSGPIIDRIDLHLELVSLNSHEISKIHQSACKNETSQIIKGRVLKAVSLQYNRSNKLNSFLKSDEVDKYCPLNDLSKQLITKAMEKFKLSARSYHRIIRLARTIADLDSSELILPKHISESISFRNNESTA